MVPFAELVRRLSAGLANSDDNFIFTDMSIYSVILLHKLLQISMALQFSDFLGDFSVAYQ